MRKNLVLTGMMGVGKSTIGKSLALKLAYSFIDIDKVIEKREGCSINSIFKNKSENYFRKLENDVTQHELKKKNSVISLGGGAFLNDSIRKNVKNASVSFWIDVSTEILIKRLCKSNKRPLLYKRNIPKTVNKIYLERKKTYSEADYRIKCGNLKVADIVKKILRMYDDSRNQI